MDTAEPTKMRMTEEEYKDYIRAIRLEQLGQLTLDVMNDILARFHKALLEAGESPLGTPEVRDRYLETERRCEVLLEGCERSVEEVRKSDAARKRREAQET